MSAGGSSNPLRQQMINMMYLVLTALLALNVSADILKAFALVNKGLDKTNISYEDKTKLTMASFAKLYELDHKKAADFYANAQNAQKTADQYFNYIQSVKEVIATRSEGWVEGSGKTAVLDDKNLETSTHYFLKEKVNGVEGWHGQKLHDSLNAFVDAMKKCLNGNINAVQFKIDTDPPKKAKDGTTKTWAEYYWEGVPSIAAITELTKFQNDIRNAEAEVTNWNYKQVGAEEQHFDNLIAMINSENPTVSAGAKYKADIVLGAYNSTVIPEIEVNGRMLSPDQIKDGVGKYEIIAGGGGEQKVAVKIFVKDPKTGQKKAYTQETSYQVFSGGATISADKMNMLYIGLPNPISAAASGFTPAQTHVNISGGGSFGKDPSQKGEGHYILKPDGSQREITVKVSVTMSDGSTKQMGQSVYRVRKIPHPEVLFGTKNGGAISRGEIATVNLISAGLGEGFAFEGLKYNVNNYTLAISPKSGQAYMEQVQGNRITGNSRSHLASVHTGDLIVIANVDATGPGGKVILSGVTLPVK
jgi:gliding motility-associated protein GldM